MFYYITNIKKYISRISCIIDCRSKYEILKEPIQNTSVFMPISIN